MTALHQTLEALEDNIRTFDELYKANGATGTGRMVRVNREAHAALKEFIDGSPDTSTALLNAVKPHYGFSATCTECREEFTADNGEWLLWCGSEKSAQSLIDSAKHLLNGLEAPGD